MRNRIEEAKQAVRNIPDFPIKGIQFKDLTTLMKSPQHLATVSDALYEMYKGKGITKVVGIESRGFIFGAVLAARLEAGFVPIRKPGKLPAEVISKTYDKEYGTDTIEIHRDAITTDDIVLIHDDLLATGGTILAALELVKSMGPRQVMINFVCGLKDLNGRDMLPKDIDVTTVFDF